MFSTVSFNGSLMAFDSALTARLRQFAQAGIALGEQDHFDSINSALRADMAAAYGTWLKDMGLPLKESDRFAHDLTLMRGMHLQNGVCVARIGKTLQYVTQSSSLVIALSGAQSPHRVNAIQHDLLPSLTDIQSNQMPVAVLDKNQHGMFVKEIILLAGQSLQSVIPYMLYLHYAKNLAELLFKQSLIISCRHEGNPIKAEVSLAPQQVRQHFKASTLDEARQVIFKQLTNPATLGMLPVFDIKKRRELRHIDILSISKIVPTSDW